MVLGDFLGKGRSTEGSDAGRKSLRRILNNVGDDLRHAQKGVVLDALGGADEQHFGAQVRQHRQKDTTGVVRRHHADDDVGIAQRFFETVGCGDGSGDGMTGKKEIVHVARVDALADFRFVRPEAHFARPVYVPARSRGPCPKLRLR